jgi:phosphoribosylaminoimidazolecarboxamide formyltransferase / IMP cyclohydrolase
VSTIQQPTQAETESERIGSRMRALLSVWDKTGIARVAQQLLEAGFELVSTGGTLRAIQQAGLPVQGVSDMTGFPELIGGRVKTLHPAIHGGLLARRDLPEHLDEIRRHGIVPIDLVVSNLYPFGEVVRRDGMTLEDALEHIDIGGPTLIRASAKNFPSVIVLVDPADYDPAVQAIAAGGLAGVTLERRRELAAKAFAHVTAYDSVIAAYLRTGTELPEQVSIAGEKVTDLRYGENPHQQAAFYRLLAPQGPHGVGTWRLLGGKEMSYNNYLDASAAWAAAIDFPDPAVAIVKHNVPCGVASDGEPADAYEAALACDPVSAFGGVVAINRPVDQELAALIAERYYEVVLAPAYDPDALPRLRRNKKNLRLIEVPESRPSDPPLETRTLDGAFLVQTPDRVQPDLSSWRQVTRRAPTSEEMGDLAFAWRVVRHVQSNAIVLASAKATVGIGGGQPNRVDAVRIAVERAGERAAGSVLASDAFFPFPDGVEAAAVAGVTSIAQPGGSVRDQESIEAADRAGTAMVFTGIRHFRH